MKVNIIKHPMDSHDKLAADSGVGANALWSGPFNTDSLPKGKGSSSGKNGIILNNDKPNYLAGPITQRAKARF
ncbi:MAG: hypothetical protein ACOVK2_05835 [Candidatus Fonsibacter sp.]|jgi:hypothetical protein